MGCWTWGIISGLFSDASDRPGGHEQGGGAVGGQEALQGVKFYLSFCGCFDREQTDDGNLSSSSTEFSSDTESDSMSEPLINYQRDIISKDHDDVSSDESDQMI